jgi:Tfp pilus assembly protein PilP
MRLLQRFSLLSLAAGTLSLAVACGDQGAQQPGSVSAPPGGVTDCTVSVDKATGTSRVEKFPAGTDCEAMRKLAAEGKPLPTIGAPKAATAVAPTTAPKFAAPFVTGRDNKTELIEPTDAKARTQELENAIASPDDKKIRDPFGSSILNPVPDVQKILDDERRRKENIIRTEAERKERQEKLREAIRVKIAKEALERQRRVAAKPKPRPRTDEAEAVRVTGTVELNGTVYAIVSAPEEPSSRYVRAGQDLSAGKVLVKRIDTNAVPPIVVLQQNGIEVLRAVGAPVVAKVPSAPAAATPAPQAMPPQ